VGYFRLASAGSELLNSLVFVILVLLIFCVTLINQKYGVYVAVAELIISSKGYLFYLLINDFKLSIRLGIFLVVLLAWLINTIRKKNWRSLSDFFAFKQYFLLALVILWGLVWALIQNNGLMRVFLDFNGWLYFAYLPVYLTTINSQEKIKEILQVILAAIFALSLKSLLAFYIFSHYLTCGYVFYKWIRDTGVGEITLLSGNIFRIFFQSQIFIIFGFLLSVCQIIFNKTLKSYWQWGIVATVTLASTLISLSRSNWLGLIVALIFLLVILILRFKFKVFDLLRLVPRFLIIIISSVALLGVILFFPFPKVQEINLSSLSSRFQTDDAAVSSRMSQLPALAKAISSHPVVGSGWGKTAVYITQDPRILNEDPSGVYETYAFEWGYFDLILKIGLVGLVIYLGVFFKLFQKIWILMTVDREIDEKIFFLWLFLGLIAILVIHSFSPYLNHPLGIGYLMLTTVFVTFYLYKTKKQP
jgi:hypothetical protein